MPNCAKLETCDKIEIVLDKDLPFDELYASEIQAVCVNCEEKEAMKDLHKLD